MIKRFPRCNIVTLSSTNLIDKLINDPQYRIPFENCTVRRHNALDLLDLDKEIEDAIFIAEIKSVDEAFALTRDHDFSYPLILIGPTVNLHNYKKLKELGIFDYHDAAEENAVLIKCIGDAISSVVMTKDGTVIGFYPSHGGCGSSTLACLTACFLSGESSKRTLIIDLDLSYGLSCIFFETNTSDALVDLLNLRNITEDSVKASAVQLTENLELLHANGVFGISLSDELSKVIEIINKARSSYEFVILDFPAGWSELHFALLERLDFLVCVTTPTIKGYKNKFSFDGTQLLQNFDNFNKITVINKFTDTTDDRVICESIREKSLDKTIVIGPDNALSNNKMNLDLNNYSNMFLSEAFIQLKNLINYDFLEKNVSTYEKKNKKSIGNKIIQRLFYNQKGVVAVEFILMVPFIMALFTFVAEYSYAHVDKQSASLFMEEFTQFANVSQSSVITENYVSDRVIVINNGPTFFRSQIVDSSVDQICFCGSAIVDCAVVGCEGENKRYESIKVTMTLQYTSDGSSYLPDFTLPTDTIIGYASLID